MNTCVELFTVVKFHITIIMEKKFMAPSIGCESVIQYYVSYTYEHTLNVRTNNVLIT